MDKLVSSQETLTKFVVFAHHKTVLDLLQEVSSCANDFIFLYFEVFEIYPCSGSRCYCQRFFDVPVLVAYARACLSAITVKLHLSGGLTVPEPVSRVT